jgi:hypothetical protein
MTERILLPLDGSKTSEAALGAVKNIISQFVPDTEVEVTLLLVIKSLTHYIFYQTLAVKANYTPEELKQLNNTTVYYLQKAGERLLVRVTLLKIFYQHANNLNLMFLRNTPTLQSGEVYLRIFDIIQSEFYSWKIINVE